MGIKMKKIGVLLALLLSSTLLNAQNIEVRSRDGKIKLMVTTGEQIEWSVQHDGRQIIAPSPISLELEDGEVLGTNTEIASKTSERVDDQFEPINYKRAVIQDRYNQLTLQFEGNYGINFRVYNEAVAYRFFTERDGGLTILNEEANFNFTDDHRALIPYMWDYRADKIFNSSFEALYDDHKISEFKPDSLAFLPLLVDVGEGKKVVILEADLEDYPGMYLDLNNTNKGFKGVYPRYPLEINQAGITEFALNLIPTKRADYIAKTEGTRTFPWRVAVISEKDKELLNVDIVQKLASPPRIEDTSWIKPGQVAWEWWNGWNISHVDFRAGQNTDTYKYYIDFASDNGLKYVIFDAGWNVPGDLGQPRNEIDLQEIIAYADDREVGVVLWASWKNTLDQMDDVFPLYEEWGVKGLKIDFIDRDDQIAVASTYEMAKKAAEHHLMVDYHGVFKPTGLQRTYPNVVGYEGVMGLEWAKWSNYNMARYAVSIPFIRMMAGPMDYTPGGMRNANRESFRPVNSMPMTQGTRTHQVAMYVMYEVPFQMLADNPTIYMEEQETTDFITSIPTTFDETVPLDGEVGEYAAIARRKGNTWYASAMTNWTGRELTIDFSFLEKGKTYQAVIFRDGVNADRDGTDYVKEEIKISGGDSLTIELAPGGGWAARISEEM